jgi:hypothetical protein
MNRTLILGNGKSGSWRIRGEQLGNAIGATVAVRPGDIVGFERAVFVKRVDARALDLVRKAKLPVIWDIVDAWPQPHGNTWNQDACLRWLKGQLEAIKPYAVVAATKTMKEDIVKKIGFKGPILALPHHARPGQAINPIRPEVRRVGYEGGVAYLGAWAELLERECAKRGWTFVLNPPALADLDIVVAFRDARGYAARQWKSNVKLANAQGSGTPFVGNPEAGYLENAGFGTYFADDKVGLHQCFDAWTPVEERRWRSQALLESQPRLEIIAAWYGAWLKTI